MQDAGGAGDSLKGSFKNLTGDVLAALGQRLELVGLELRAAERRAFWRGAVALFAAFVGIQSFVCLTFGLALLFWPDQMALALIWIGAAYLVVGLVAGLFTFQKLRKKPLPLGTLVSVLKEDSEWILGKKPD